MTSIHTQLLATSPTKAFFLVRPSKKTSGELEIAWVEEWDSFFEGVGSEDVRIFLSFVFIPLIFVGFFTFVLPLPGRVRVEPLFHISYPRYYF